MFEQPLASPTQSEFDDPSWGTKGEFRVPASKEASSPRAPIGADRIRPLAQAASPAGDLSRPTDIPKPVGANTSPGEFTQLFQAITPNAQAIEQDEWKQSSLSSKTPPPPPAAADEKAADSKAGEFTRIFMRLPKDPDPAPPSEVPASRQVSGSQQAADTLRTSGNLKAASNAQASETGEFTRLMRAAEMGTKPPGPASFSAEPPSTPVRGISAQGSNDAVSGTAGVTELFLGPSHGPGAAPPSSTSAGAVPQSEKASLLSERATPASDPVWRSGPGSSLFQDASLRRGEPDPGEFTQLFRALDKDRECSTPTASMATPSPGPSPTVPKPGRLPDTTAGEFTQLLQSLSHDRSRGESRPETPPQPLPYRTVPDAAQRGWPEAMPAQSAGLAEDSASFTRIISSSAAREEAARGSKSAGEASAAKGGASASAGGPWPPMAQPLQAPSPPRAPSFGQISGAPPPAPVLASPASASAPKSKLQAYLPLLLVINAFALAVLIVLILFALRRH
jgi:hypothetical protein